MIGEGIADAYNSKEAQAILAGGFGLIEEAYTMSADKAQEALRAAAGLAAVGCASVEAFLRMEIIRDFAQIVGSVFATAYVKAGGALKAVARSFGSLFNLVTLNLGAALNSPEAAVAGIVIAILLALCAVASYIWMIWSSGVLSMAYADEDALREGKEGKGSFREQALSMKDSLWKIEKVIALCLAVYLPIGTYICQIVFCDYSSPIVLKFTLDAKPMKYCETSSEIKNLTLLSYFIGITFLLPLPIFLGMCINATKPKGNIEQPDKIFDQDGMMVDFTDEVYNNIVENDITQQLNPFRSLYQGFENKFALYKVGMLVWKFFLVAPTVALSASYAVSDTTASGPVGAALFQCVILIIQAVGFWYMQPFIDDNTDYMDASGRISAAVCALGGVVAASATISAATKEADSNGLTTFIGIVVMVTNLINSGIMGYFTMIGFPYFQLTLKNISGRFTFSNTCNNRKGLSAIQALKSWDISKEVKHRVWQAFWNGILLQKCGDDVCERLITLQKATVDSGLEQIENHWSGERIPQVANNRQTLRADMEGCDMYWNDASGTLDGVLDSKTGFGKLIVQAYPFNIRIAYDDSDDVSFVKTNNKIDEFVKLNTSPDIMGRRRIRKNLRCMSDAQTRCNWPHSQWETVIVDDGFEERQVRNADGEGYHTERVPVTSSVEIQVFYTEGVLSVGTTDASEHTARGFTPIMSYNDGHGSGVKPRTGEHFTKTGMHTTKGGDHFGLNDKFQMSEGLERLFGLGASDIEQRYEPMLQAEQEHRAEVMEKERAANAVLGDGFWYFVYNDYKLSRENLGRYLANNETNPLLKTLPKDHNAGLDFLYKKLGIVSLSKANEVWYIFWEDFYHNNKDMAIMAEKIPLVDPSRALSLCYRPMERSDFTALMKRHGLYQENEDSYINVYAPILCKQYFNKEILDALYDKVEGREVGSTFAGANAKQE
jgi:hypothetical protein